MSEHHATIRWKRKSADFSYENYNRSHMWEFEGVDVPASSAPEFRGDPELVDPEEAFVASVSACHMLTFLALAAKKRFVVDQYTDNAVGLMEKNRDGKLAITKVTLKPAIEFSGDKRPSAEDIDRLHDQAHEHCFIANSVRTSITVEAE